jgi:hypothetical protein
MTNDVIEVDSLGKMLHSHSLTIRYDEFEDGVICLKLVPDEQVEAAERLIGNDLARLGASRAFIGIHALKWCLEESIIEHSFKLADEVIENHGDGCNSGFDPRSMQGLPLELSVN